MRFKGSHFAALFLKVSMGILGHLVAVLLFPGSVGGSLSSDNVPGGTVRYRDGQTMVKTSSGGWNKTY
jgi:hypothetical protein